MSALRIVSPSTPLLVDLVFAGALASAGTVTIQSRQMVRGGAPLAGSGELASGVGAVRVTLTGGADGEQYDVSVRADLAAGGVAEIEFAVICIDPHWQMADGSPGLVSIISFAEGFGIDELMTAATAPGSQVIDRVWLVGALRDAQARAMAEVARRYALPLAFTPDILKTAISDIAAERLYRRGTPPDHISAAAKVARGDLQRIGSGDLPLAGLAGLIASSGGSEGGFSIHPGDTSFLSGLGDYVRGNDYDRY